MNSKTISNGDKRCAFRIAISMPAILAASVAATALLAQTSPTPTSSPTPQPQKGKCQQWAADLTPQQKTTIKKAFVQAINNSLVNDNFRKKLLLKGTCYESPKNEINMWIYNLDHDPKLQLPTDATVVFFDPDAETSSTPSPEPSAAHTTFYHADQCWHIFWLPPPGSAPLPDDDQHLDQSFQQQLKCCYQPW